jgi:RNA polymerase sigma-70 factor (ECF subfamily)
MSTQESEELLAQRAAAADESALAELLRRHGPQVRAQVETEIAAKWRSVLDAEDVMQVTYLEAFLTINRFRHRGAGSFGAWLLMIARNNLRDAIDELGRQKRPNPDRRVIPSDESAAILLDKLGCTSSTPSRDAGRREVSAALESALGRLADDYAQVVRLYDLEGRTASEIARTMGRSEGAVYMLRARAHDKLREDFSSASGIIG